MGRPPNRSSDLSPAGEQKRKQRGTKTTKAKSGNVTIPEPNPDWGHTAKLLWNSLHDSGQSVFYEASDWAMAYIACDNLDHLEGQSRRSPELLRNVTQIMTSLLVTEADRRKVHIELDKEDDDHSGIVGEVTDLFERFGEKQVT